MASGLLMSAPVCLIENSNGQFMVNQDALQVLTTVTQPVVVVAIVGLYRTGKSYLMNKLAGQNTGFSLGSTVQSHTKGIWMWCVPHPKEPNHTLILLDTEGLGDVEKGDNKNDTWIFALAVLLSSTFVYNSMGTISQQTMDQLHYVTELTDKIKAKSSPSTEQMNDSMEFASLFPDFVWTVRDFILELEIDGQPITSDQYLENALKLKKGTSEEARICIQKFFPNRKCFIFVPPAHRKKLKQLEELHDDELDIDFVENTKNFCDYIFKNAKAKTLPGGGTVNGFRLGKLVLNYVEAITSGDIPCMENAVLALAQLENSAAVQRSLTLYEEMMRQKVRFPTETLQELLDAHIVCKSEATKSFIKDSFKDVNQEFQKTLEIQLEAKLDDFHKQNERESLDQCTALLQAIFSPLEEAVKQNAFSKPGGYGMFLQKKEELIYKYHQQPKKGIQADKTLEEYLKSKETVADAINQTDKMLTAKEEEKKEQQRKAQVAADAARALEIQQRRQEQIRLENERRQQEQLRQMAANIGAQRRQWLAEQEREQARRLQEQAQLLQEQQRREIAEQQRQIQILLAQHHNCNSDNDCIIL
ncbi:guanylate-binding protein 1-like isoform X1 [Phascolarctos cinereus]|uniref:Guanylate-binding protein 1-like isoform X1 n=1 Tax=Phascolarctos cinereus TaxID=38626 RepID=A0A6P5KHF0_PHACI|nr:guanylate-binding protein 1-like isoform X1 [Phascolarctos cinereus]XP_020844435.1 guanylate-binding protein 1-like isoform X1 [Phascolarctos cinereus]